MNQSLWTPGSIAQGAVSHLRWEYEERQALFAAQPAVIQRFVEAQARRLGEALVRGEPDVQFALPECVVPGALPAGSAGPVATSLLVVPPARREHRVGGVLERVKRTQLGEAVRQRLVALEHGDDPGEAAAAGLLRHATAMHLVHGVLPAGRPVTYQLAEGDEIPSLPLPAPEPARPALTAATDVIAEAEPCAAADDALVAPYVPAARRFFLPQWVAFDDVDRLLAGTLEEAETLVGALQRYAGVLHLAVALAPYLVADDEYQRRRYGVLGQLVNQGRALARYETGQVIEIVRARAAAHSLDRGLRVSLPYFDDQALACRTYAFDVIPAGRVPFLAAFVVRAAQQEQAKAAQDTRLSHSTRRHLLTELRTLERAFTTAAALHGPRFER